jgi:YegS/Rv2252/BmrU family lipid kinase
MNIDQKDNWLVIVNPEAGVHKTRAQLLTVLRKVRNAGFNITVKFTQRKNHATELAVKYAARGFKNFIIAGGDGTVNEVVNGIFLQKDIPAVDFCIGLLPIGSGNDLCKMYNIPENLDNAIEVLKNGHIANQDIGRISYYYKNKKKSKYFVNIAGLGFDAFVTQRTNKWKEKFLKGKVLYMLALISSLAEYRSKKVKISCNGKLLLNSKVFSIAVGIGKYNGGGMMQVPDAIADDGLFDVTVIERMSKAEIIRNVKNLYDGSFINNPKVKLFRLESLEIESEQRLMLEADGESLGFGPFEFGISPKSLNIISGKKAI